MGTFGTGACIVAAALCAGAVRAGDLEDRGRAIAEAHCSRCHVVGDYNPMGGISSTPSFQLLVNELPDWEDRFSTFQARRPHPSQIVFKGVEKPEFLAPGFKPVELELSDIDAIVAFAATLKRK